MLTELYPNTFQIQIIKIHSLTQKFLRILEPEEKIWSENVKFWAHKKVIEIPQWGNQFINDAFHAREQKLHEGKLNI